MPLFELDFKYGITEFGDASQVFCWASFIKNVICAIIISRGANEKFAEKLLDNKDKIIYHARISGFGGTLFEPNVPSYHEIFKQIEYIIYRGFSPDQIVIDVDPIIPYCWVDKLNLILNIDYLDNIKNILELTEEHGIKRVRQNFLNYEYNILNNIKKFNHTLTLDPDWTYDPWNEISLHIFNKYLKYESASPIFKFVEMTPIISNEDLKILNLYNKYMFNSLYDIEKNKLELIGLNETCKHNCVYCHNKNFLNNCIL